MFYSRDPSRCQLEGRQINRRVLKYLVGRIFIDNFGTENINKYR